MYHNRHLIKVLNKTIRAGMQIDPNWKLICLVFGGTNLSILWLVQGLWEDYKLKSFVKLKRKGKTLKLQAIALLRTLVTTEYREDPMVGWMPIVGINMKSHSLVLL